MPPRHRTSQSVLLLVFLSLVLGLGSNLFRTQPLPVFKPLPAFFPGELSVRQADTFLRRKEAVFWDVRAPEAYRESHLPGALSPQTTPPQDEKIVVYCSSRLCPKAQEAATRLRAHGYKQVFVMPEGVQGWQAAGYALWRAPQ